MIPQGRNLNHGLNGDGVTARRVGQTQPCDAGPARVRGYSSGLGQHDLAPEVNKAALATLRHTSLAVELNARLRLRDLYVYRGGTGRMPKATETMEVQACWQICLGLCSRMSTIWTIHSSLDHFSETSGEADV
jgi:hypothetical protein